MYASYFAEPQAPKPCSYAPIAQCAKEIEFSKILEWGKQMGIKDENIEKNKDIFARINHLHGQGDIDPKRHLIRELETIKIDQDSGRDVEKQRKVNTFFQQRRDTYLNEISGWDEDTEELLNAEIKGGFIDGIFLNTFGQCLVMCCWIKRDDVAKNWAYWPAKYFALALSFGLYIMCLAFIAGVQLSVDACHAGLIHDSFNGNITLRCTNMVENCKFQWLTSYRETGLSDYLKWRLASYILSLLPLMFMAYASGRHMKNTVNKLLDKHDIKKNQAMSTNGGTIQVRYWGNLLSKGRLETISLIIFFVVYIVIGSLMLALDIQFAKFLNTDGEDGGGACKDSFSEKQGYIAFLQPNQTPETLCKILLSFNCLSMIWSVFYVVVTTYRTCCGHIQRDEAAKTLHYKNPHFHVHSPLPHAGGLSSHALHVGSFPAHGHGGGATASV